MLPPAEHTLSARVHICVRTCVQVCVCVDTRPGMHGSLCRLLIKPQRAFNMLLEQQATGWRERRRGGGGEGAGGYVRGGKANFSVITLPSCWWGAQALRLPTDKL